MISNPVLQAIMDRRSIRSYRPGQVPADMLDTILGAAQAAPSARNTQPWHLTAVQDAALLARVNEAFRAQALLQAPPDMRETVADPAYSVFHHAPTVVFISCPELSGMRYAQTDCGIAAENMALAAHALGLGSVILGMPRMAFEGPEADDLREALAFPAGYDYILSIAIGFPAASKDAHPVLDGRVTVLR